MRVQIALRTSNNALFYRTYNDVQALVNPNTHVLQIFYNKVLIAEYQSDAYLSWEFVATPQQPTASRAQLLLQHHEK